MGAVGSVNHWWFAGSSRILTPSLFTKLTGKKPGAGDYVQPNLYQVVCCNTPPSTNDASFSSMSSSKFLASFKFMVLPES